MERPQGGDQERGAVAARAAVDGQDHDDRAVPRFPVLEGAGDVLGPVLMLEQARLGMVAIARGELLVVGSEPAAEQPIGRLSRRFELRPVSGDLRAVVQYHLLPVQDHDMLLDA